MDSKEYVAEVDAALRRTPERAARLQDLERAFQEADSDVEIREAGEEIGALLDEAFAEVNAQRQTSGKPRT